MQKRQIMKAKLKCYISAPAGFDLNKLESILQKQDIDYHNFYDFSIGSSFSDLIRRKIRESDFVIAVLSEENSNVVFEIGVAEGLRKPTFILVNKKIDTPFFISNKLYYQTNFEDFSLIELALSNFIVDIKNKKKYAPIKENNDTLSIDKTNNTLSEIRQLRRNPKEENILKVIKDTFSTIDIQNVSINDSINDKGVDLIIRSENLKPYFGNPIFIEIIAGNITTERLINTEQRLLKYLQSSEAKAGLILYLDKNDKRFVIHKQTTPLILFFDVEDFINGIASEGFDRLLINTRNEVVHGLK